MALNEIKQQVVLMLQSVLTLDAPERSEAMGFLKDCVSNFGLSAAKEESSVAASMHQANSAASTFPEASTPWMNHLREAYHETEYSKSNHYYPDSYSYHDTNDSRVNLVQEEQSSPTDLSKSTWLNYNNSSNDLLLLESKKKNLETENQEKPVVEVQKKSRRKQMFTRKSVRRVATVKDVTKENETEVKKEVKKVKKIKVSKRKKIKDDKEDEENSVYKCPGCSVLFETKAQLLLHFKSHPKAPMSCRMCRLYFSKVLHFWRHEKNGKCESAQLDCAECGEKFKYRRHYLKHVVGHNDNNCKYCDEKFSTWLHYKNHLKLKHPDVKVERDLIPCKFCNLSFRRHLGLYNHYRVKHSKGKFVCLSCGLLLPTKEKFKEHTQVHEAEKNYKCKICKMKFYRRQQLLFHVNVHKSETYKCVTCNITVTSKADLSKHKKDGHEVKGLEPKFKCDVCDKKFDKQTKLKNHSLTHSSEKNYYCKHCVKHFSSMESLLKHEKRKSHLDKAQIQIPESKYEKVYEDRLICETCGKLFLTISSLKSHLRTHKDIFQCQQCSKTFTLKINLTKHLKLHNNSVGVVCELCGDTLSTLSALNEHNLLKHSDIRKEKCEICEKTFKRKSELNRHMRGHGNKRTFQCPYCSKSYRQSGHLRQHYKSAHGKSTEPNVIDSQNFTNNEIYNEGMIERKEYVNPDQNNLLPIGNIENPQDYRPEPDYNEIEVHEQKVFENAYPVRYPHNEMEPMNVTYEDLNFGNAQNDKREMVFNSPAVDLSMVAISEVVQGGMSLDESQRDVGPVENYKQISDDNSHIQSLINTAIAETLQSNYDTIRLIFNENI